MRVSQLKLTNFRNYSSLDLELEPGITLIEGPNGQGKTNLLESIYLMSIGRSSRTSSDRDLVRTTAFDDIQIHSQVVGDIATIGGAIQLQVDLSGGLSNGSGPDTRINGSEPRIQKTFRVNGVPRRTSDFVGLLKAVLFAAEDLDLTGGPPAIRRRYLDILVSQLTPGYVRKIQEYQKVMTQRNHLLKRIRQRESKESELEFWDVQLAIYAARIMDARARVIHTLSTTSQPIHRSLSGVDDELKLSYRPSINLGAYEDARELSKILLEAIHAQRGPDIASGHCNVGPHRDDLSAAIDGMEVGVYASRGQSRTVVLAMKLGEAQLLQEASGDQPVILLDDVMSELDPDRRQQAVDRFYEYEQVFLTTAEPDRLGGLIRDDVTRLSIKSGEVLAAG